MRYITNVLYNRNVISIEALADPVRRRVLELVATDELPAGQITEVVGAEFGISQPGTSRHLRVLREAGLVRVRVERSRRLYAIEPSGLAEVEQWLQHLRTLWSTAFTSLETEVARGKRVANQSSGDNR